MLTSVFSSFIVVFVVTAFFRLAKRYLSAPAPANKLDPLEVERLEKIYRSWPALISILFFIFAIASGILWFFLLCEFGDYVMKPGPEVEFQIDPRHFFWCLPALLLGIISGGVLGELCLRTFARNRYAEFRRYSQIKSSIDSARLMRWTVPLAVLPALIFVVCQVCDVTRFSRDGLSIAHFGQFSHPSYSYSQIKALRFFPLTFDAQGHVKDRPEYQMDLMDGTSWTTESFFRDMSPAYDRRAFEYVAERSGIAIVAQDRASR